MANFYIADLFFAKDAYVDSLPTRPKHYEISHDDWLIKGINSTVSYNDKLFILGNIGFSNSSLACLNAIKCEDIRLILGPSDTRNIFAYKHIRKIKKVYGCLQQNKLLLTNIPAHNAALHGKVNVHGSTITTEELSDFHINVGVDTIGNIPMKINSLDPFNTY